MSNADVVRRAFAAAERADKAELYRCLDPQVQWHMLGLVADHEVVRRGREAVWSYSHTVQSAFDDLVNDLDDPVEIGDQVVMRIHTHGRGRGGAPDIDVSYTGVFLVRDDRIVSGENFEDHEEALTEAALRA